MVKIPKAKKMYCPKCKKHTEHKVKINKTKRGSALKHGSKYRAEKRGASGTGNLGRYSKPPATKFKLGGKKSTKKTDLRYTCSECGKTQIMGQGNRAKKVEFQA